MSAELTVYVNVTSLKDSGTYGDTTIVLPKDDQHRAGFLKSCEEFMKINGRPQDADKFYQAGKQTPWDDKDNG